MIRIRVKASHVTIRVNGGPKQRYASAIHALHVVRVALVGNGTAIDASARTQVALRHLLARAQAELAAAISDVVRLAWYEIG